MGIIVTEPGVAELAPGALVHGGKVGVQVAGVAAAARHLLARGGHLAQGLGVVGDVGQDDQHVHALLKGEVLRGGQRHARRRDTLNRGVGGEVREENGALHRAGAAELVGEELSLLERDADGGKHDGEARVCASSTLA